nr:isochorismate synthase [Microbacterium pseudoresistens]
MVVETREIDPVEDLLAYADPDAPLAWLRRGDGIVAIGAGVPGPGTMREIRVPAMPEPSPAGTRTAAAADAWRALVAEAEIDDPVRLPGTGLVGFGALVFDERSVRESVILVPRAVIGRHEGRSWITRIRGDHDLPTPEAVPLPYGPHWAGTLGPGAQTAEGYQDAVRRALDEIAGGAYSKVVLARDLTGTIPAGADVRRLARALSSDYPDTWTFAVDGLIGASPETLVTSRGGRVTARVLAGTTARGADPDGDTAASADLASSTKDLDEHQYAVQSVLSALRTHTRALAASEQPFTLRLPNLFHLATDVEGELSDGSTVLDLVGTLHPTAAVAGTPTDAAIEAIHRIEPFDRGRYAGPVGWLDADGGGEWAIALRCAQIGAPPARRHAEYSDTIPVTAYAGAGIVAGSHPESELLETRVKFRPVVDALA